MNVKGFNNCTLSITVTFFGLFNSNARIIRFKSYNYIFLDLYSKIRKSVDGWHCLVCGFNFKNKSSCLLHVEAIHISGGHICEHCKKFCPSKNALRTHTSRYHRNEKFWVLLLGAVYLMTETYLTQFYHLTACICFCINYYN